MPSALISVGLPLLWTRPYHPPIGPLQELCPVHIVSLSPSTSTHCVHCTVVFQILAINDPIWSFWISFILMFWKYTTSYFAVNSLETFWTQKLGFSLRYRSRYGFAQKKPTREQHKIFLEQTNHIVFSFLRILPRSYATTNHCNIINATQSNSRNSPNSQILICYLTKQLKHWYWPKTLTMTKIPLE